eukprot:4098182-Pleurochrysis_carterae.AAC.2
MWLPRHRRRSKHVNVARCTGLLRALKGLQFLTLCFSPVTVERAFGIGRKLRVDKNAYRCSRPWGRMYLLYMTDAALVTCVRSFVTSVRL